MMRDLAAKIAQDLSDEYWQQIDEEHQFLMKCKSKGPSV